VTIPRLALPKNKSGIHENSLAPRKYRQPTSFSPAIHHKFTIKKPRSTIRFAKTPSKNAQIHHVKKIAQTSAVAQFLNLLYRELSVERDLGLFG
jgi:hypothetical protein